MPRKEALRLESLLLGYQQLLVVYILQDADRMSDVECCFVELKTQEDGCLEVYFRVKVQGLVKTFYVNDAGKMERLSKGSIFKPERFPHSLMTCKRVDCYKSIYLMFAFQGPCADPITVAYRQEDLL